jgi:MerR family transcriptional regulator, light-induced transcriptional regulator
MTEYEIEPADIAEITELQQTYLRELLAGRRTAAHELIMDAFHKGRAIPEIYVKVLQTSLYEIGRLWENNQISVSDEHMGTVITQYIMSDLYQHLEIADIQRGRLVMTGVHGEMHQVGVNMVSDLLEADGWDVMFLGANVPPRNVIQAIRQHEADLLGISATLYINIPKVIRLVTMVKEEFGDKSPHILLGGHAFFTGTERSTELEGCLLPRDIEETLELTRLLT